MNLTAILQAMEDFAPLQDQEPWDNTGLLVGSPDMDITGVMVSLDPTREVLREALEMGCNLIVSHHPLLFQGVKRFTPVCPEYDIIREAIRHDIAIVAMHTNLDNQLTGINHVWASRLALQQLAILKPQRGRVKKLVTFSPQGFASSIREALFRVGGGHIGKYDSCSFSVEGNGTFRGSSDSQPFVGKPLELHTEREERIEVVFPDYLEGLIIRQLRSSHPYEEVAFDIYSLDNCLPYVGAGIIGELQKPVKKQDFLMMVKEVFDAKVLRISRCRKEDVSMVAICSGSGADLIPDAMAAGADAFLTGDLKYHTFQREGQEMVLVDIGHYESEMVVKQVVYAILKEKFPTFAVFISEQEQNPIIYL
ncbi:MAG: Nif3-like dinuclear metal center hexameric protein [Bacteroidales bacterium]|nr:Nif3-like dinuclear metal center hexameric protein [Bacteroidales bacterium]